MKSLVLLAVFSAFSTAQAQGFATVVHSAILPGPVRQNAEPPPQAPLLQAGNVLTVRLDVTHKVQEVAKGVSINVWAFGDSVPGPTIRVREGDRIHFIMANRSSETAEVSPPMPHSIDFHAATASPQDLFRSIAPGQTIEFEFVAGYPGVFMYHCGTPMLLHHMAMGMYGAVIVEPRGGYPTRADREYVLVQSEFYPSPNGDLDMTAVKQKRPSIVAFNGRAFRHQKEPLKAVAGERVRLFVLNAGPNDTSSFHIVGTIMDRVWLDGSPLNELRGLQTVLLGSSNSAIVEFVIPAAGQYFAVDHEFADTEAGALAVIDASAAPKR